MTKKRELSPNEIKSAERLRKIWNEKKAELNLNQEKIALECGWSGQSAFSQYYHARVPLNTEAVLKLAKVLQVEPTEIMPEIAEILPKTEPRKLEIRETYSSGLKSKTIEIAKDLEELTPEQQALIEQTIKMFKSTNQRQDKKAA